MSEIQKISQVEALKNIEADNNQKIQFIKDVLNKKIHIFNLDDNFDNKDKNKNLSERIKSFLSTLELDKKNNNSKLTEDSQNKLNEIYEELKNLEHIEQIDNIKNISNISDEVHKNDVIKAESELNILLGIDNSYDKIKRNIKYFGLLKEIYDALTTPEKSALKEILKDKTIAEASAGDIYALKKEGVNIAKLFLLDNKTGKFIKNTIGNGSELKVYFYKNPNIDKVIGIGDLLDINNISKVSINGRIGTRKSKPRPGYYDKNGRYLVVHGGYRIKILETKKASGGEFNDAIENRYKEIRKKDLQYKIYEKLQTDEKSIKLEGYNENDKKLIKEILSDNKNLKYENDTISSTNSKSLKRNINTMFAKIVPTKSMNEFLSRPGVGEKLNEIYQELGIDINSLMIVIGAESGFNPKAVNPYSGASGLLQFMPSTAKGLGTSVEAIRKMSEVDQLNLVKKYFKAYKGKLHSVVDIYKATFFPVSLKHPEKSWVFRAKGISPEKLAQQNPAIAKYSTRADGFIDGYAFERYVQAHIGSQVSYVNDRKNIVDDYVKNYNEKRKVSRVEENNKGGEIVIKIDEAKKREVSEIINDKNKKIPSLNFKHGKEDYFEKIIKKNLDLIKASNSVFIFKEGKQNLSLGEIKKIVEIIKNKAGKNVNIYIDQEGGNVNRYKEDFSDLEKDYGNLLKENKAKRKIFDLLKGKTFFPSPKDIGKKYDSLPDNLKQDFLNGMALIRLESLKKVGIMTYGMVCDLSFGNGVTDGSGRSFSSDINKYKKWGDAMVTASEKTGVSLYLKHFPGHGMTGDKIKNSNGKGANDSHLGTYSLINKSYYIKRNMELFDYILKKSNNEASVMVGHILLNNDVKEDFNRILKKAKTILTDDTTDMKGFTKVTGYQSNNSFFTTDYIAKNLKGKLKVVAKSYRAK